MSSSLLNWSDQTVLILASGPSLREFIRDGELPKDVRTIAVNSTVFATPAVDVVFGIDFMWWKMHHQAARRASKAQLWTTDRSASERFDLRFARGVNESGLHPSRVNNNGNSGAAAINLATLFGVKRILLLGFDMQPGPGGERHWHPDHPKPCVQAQCFSDWLHRFDALAKGCDDAGVSVINCTPDSALKQFKNMTLSEALACPVQ